MIFDIIIVGAIDVSLQRYHISRWYPASPVFIIADVMNIQNEALLSTLLLRNAYLDEQVLTDAASFN